MSKIESGVKVKVIDAVYTMSRIGDIGIVTGRHGSFNDGWVVKFPFKFYRKIGT
jgi:hypothetical protein